MTWSPIICNQKIILKRPSPKTPTVVLQIYDVPHLEWAHLRDFEPIFMSNTNQFSDSHVYGLEGFDISVSTVGKYTQNFQKSDEFGFRFIFKACYQAFC